MSKVLSVIGMHRSGTSLLALYLYESGLFIGTDLLGPHESNPAGHFEDRDFLTLHNAILSAHHVDHKVTAAVNWSIDSHFEEQAKRLIAARDGFPQWGWKDPRTCLFLPFWKRLIPGCHFIITYRPYEPVIQSLISRDIWMYRDTTNRLRRIIQRRYGTDELTEAANTYLKVWIMYYSEILKHVLEDPSTSFSFVPFSQLILGDFHFLSALKDNGFKLTTPNHFNPRLTKSKTARSMLLRLDEGLVHQANVLDDRIMQAKVRVGLH